MYSVKDGIRTLNFDGEKLAFSSSSSPGKPRWIEFTLFKTVGGDYVLARVGATMVYHAGYCEIVRRNRLDPLPSDVVSHNLIPCEKCKPSRDRDTDLFPEYPRYWATVVQEPEGVVACMRKVDETGTEYLTAVSHRLLVEAAKNDEGIHKAYYTEWIE